MSVNRRWKLKKRPVGDLAPGDLELVSEAVPTPGPGQILIRNIYLSLDPTNRIWMSDMDQYMPPVEIGDVMRGGTIGVVEASNNPGFKPGDIVQPFDMGWQDYVVSNGAQKLQVGPDLPILAYMGGLGMTAITAYFGLLDIGKPKPGETVVVSAAAGAVGSIVGQIAKLKGCHVVGLAGSDDKCKWVVDELGFDACINYRTENVLEALRRECPKGIDVYFENVGGEILDAVLTLINLEARIPVCGLISTYNADGPVPGPYMFRNILMKRALLKGFIVIDYFPRIAEFFADMPGWLASGQIKWKVDVRQGLENAPVVLQDLFTGGNTGKLVVQIGPEP
ncbi:NADPH-dependent curcumin reductase [Alphaproteobacteria bacterium SO-S41]|nr:NADPH-dependent curcumin reductase [Alphaproteobacteria bacterium SO-S41]